MLSSDREINSREEQNAELQKLTEIDKFMTGMWGIATFPFVVEKHLLPIKDVSDAEYSVYVMIGLPGSGKDTYIKNHMDVDIPMISRDNIRVDLGLCAPDEKYVGTEEEENRVSIEFDSRLKKALIEDKCVIINNINFKRKYRNKIKDDIKKITNNAKVEYFYIYAQAPSLKDNLERRKKNFTEDIFNKIIDSFDFPTYDEYTYMYNAF